MLNKIVPMNIIYKSFFCVAVTLIPVFCNALEVNQKDEIKLATNFVKTIKTKDKLNISTLFTYPLLLDEFVPPITNNQDFVKRFDEVFDSNLMNLIINSDLKNDWVTVGWHGLGFPNGEIWLSDDGKVRDISYRTKALENIRAKNISKQKQTLHESVRDFYEPIHDVQTKKFRVRIDQLENGDYRYTAWKKGFNTSEKPSLVILKGEFEETLVSSSGLNAYLFRFRNGLYEYRVVFGTEDSDDKFISVYRDNKLIFNEPIESYYHYDERALQKSLDYRSRIK